MTKKCSKCGEIKDISYFNKRKESVDGHSGWCKLCSSEWHRKARKRYLSRIKKWREAHREMFRESAIRYKKNNKDKVRAHNTVMNELLYGRIIRGNCNICGSKRADAHHEDYSKPLDITWLCKKHHAERHYVIRLGKTRDPSSEKGGGK